MKADQARRPRRQEREYPYPWLLPSALSEEPAADGRRRRRTVRDWVVDFLCFVLAVLIGLVGLSVAEQQHGLPEALLFVDQVVGALACAALWLRRRWPVPLAVVLALVSPLSLGAGGAAVIALFTVVVHRPPRYTLWIGGLFTVTAVLVAWLRPDPTMPFAVNAVISVLLNGMVIGWGMFVRSQRRLLLSLRERARRAEAEAALRAENAQRLAREAIAREMHDVLAHRLTLLSVHAGALEFRPDAPREEVARAAGVIRDSAHEALQDLREIIGVLRTDDRGGDEASGRPQPTLDALPGLVAESVGAGMGIRLDLRVADPASAPAAIGRTAYRIAQEALTNARKHAPGADVSVRVEGGPGDGLTVHVGHPAPPGPVPPVPGSGQGLIGLTERAALAGGRLDHGPTPGGGFHVDAWLPWAA
ncbi:sensor histidine kinase [Streptomyces sp. NPDC060194]|uniref:sensor histidine kinase n=1 Tax=Streptomyces sp. NPDC060194 TaxID=3347069 RepID=UPI00365AF827